MFHRTFIALRLGLLAALIAALPAFGSVLGTYEDRSTWNGLTTGIITDDFESLGLASGGYSFYNTSSGLTRGAINYVGIDGASYTIVATANDAAGNSDTATFTAAVDITAPPEVPITAVTITRRAINYVGIDGASYTMLAINPTSGDNYFGSGTMLRGADYYSGNTQYLQLTLPGVESVGFDLGSAFPNAIGIRIELSTGEFYIRTTENAPALSFWGVQSNTPISWIRIALEPGQGASPSQYSSIAVLDNVSYGSRAAGGGNPGGGDPGGTAETPEVTTVLYVGSGIALLLMRRRQGLSHG